MNGMLINKRGVNNKTWDLIIEDIYKFLECLPDGCEIAGENGEGKPIFSKKEIIFNGKFPNHGNPLIIEHYFKSVANLKIKTHPIMRVIYFAKNNKPYDVLSKCLMLSCEHHSGGVMKIFSDQSFVDWKNAIALYEYAVERKVPEDVKKMLKTKKLKKIVKNGQI